MADEMALLFPLNGESSKYESFKLAQNLILLQKYSVRRAACVCKIPKSTLSRYLKKNGPPQQMGRPTILNYKDHLLLCRYILDHPYTAPAELLRIFPHITGKITRKQMESIKRNTLQKLNNIVRGQEGDERHHH